MLPPNPSKQQLPLYLNYYRCEGFLRGGVGDEWPMPELLRAGIAVACINGVPLPPGPEDAVAAYRDGFEAVSGLIAQLSGQGIIDPSKVGMGGLSHGSEVTWWTATHSHLLKAIATSSAEYEEGDYWLSAIPGNDQASMMRKAWGLGSPEETPRQWKQVSYALNATALDAAVLMQLPEEEARRVPELYDRVSMAGKPVELYAFPDEGHIKIEPRHRLAVYDRNLDWFRYWLQDYRDPDPAKADQYRRWDQLKERWARTSRSTSAAIARVQPSH
jgi:hypothetical protein